MAEFIPTGIGGFAARPARRKTTGQAFTSSRSWQRHELNPPPRPHRSYTPTQEAVEALLERALAAFARGIYWDRGSIINLVL